MTVATGYNPSKRQAGWDGHAILWMALLSLLFHALIVAALVLTPAPHPPVVEEAVPIELAPEEPQPPHPPAPKPEPAPEPAPPPPPPPPAPKPEPKPEPPPHAEAPPPLPPAPPKVQKTPGKLAEKATAGDPETPKPSGHSVKETAAAKMKGEGEAPGEEPREVEYKGISGPGAAEATQTARDMLLMGIFQHFTVEPQMRGLAITSLVVTVMPNGMLAAPFEGTRPSDPSLTSRGYTTLRPGDPRKRLMEEFDLAIRAAQPFHLPPALVFRAPFSIRLDFRLSDVP
jgi:hypothetical protein